MNPSEFNIGGYKYKIKEVSSDELRKVLSSNSEYVMGATDFGTQSIYIRKDLTKQSQAETLLHEITHAIVYEKGLEFKSEKKLEKFVEQIGQGLFELIKRNRGVVSFVQGAD